MIERRDTPVPLMQRRAPPPLDFRPKSKQTKSSNISPPQTPPPYKIRTRAKRASNAHADRPTPRETFLSSHDDDRDHARGARESQIRDERISHDLSLTDNNRYSVVDNMLLSLNPDQAGPFATPPESFAFPGESRFVSPRSSHRRGHTHSSSLTTDYTLPSDESPLRSSGHASRGRGSNGSSNFQSGLGRIDSVHGHDDRTDRTGVKINQTRRAYARDKASVAPTRKSRKSSRSSGSSSVDFGHIMGQTRWQSPGAWRSSSVERGYRRDSFPSPHRSVIDSPMVHSYSQPLHYDVEDAAPTPTVPVGPLSSERSPRFPPHSVHGPPELSPEPSRNTFRSSKTNYGWKNKGSSIHKGTEGKGSNAVRSAADDPSVPGFVISRNPSPTRHDEGTSTGCKQLPASQVKEQSKERPGFFRRVFGSSRNHQPSTTEASAPPLQWLGNSVRVESSGGFASPGKASKPHPHEDGSLLLKENVPPALAKKPSSFFRRRKKSVSSPNQPLVWPTNLTPHGKPDLSRAPTDHRPQSSSVSSLREVMNPYLGGAPTSQPHGGSVRDPTADGHRGSISTSTLVRNEMRANPIANTLSVSRETAPDGRTGHLRQNQPQEHGKRMESSPRATTCEAPTYPTKAKPDDVSLSIQNSFLHDSSSTESKTVRSSNNAEPIMSSSDGRDGTHKSNQPSQPFKVLPHLSTPTGKLKHLSSRSGTFPAVTPTPGNTLKPSKTADWQAKLQISSRGKKPSPIEPGKKLAGAWLATGDAGDEAQKVDRLTLPLDGVQISPISPVSDYQSASSTLVTPKTQEPRGDSTLPQVQVIDQPLSRITDFEPTEDDRLLAKRVYDGDETLTVKERAAAWLGDAEPGRERVRRAYMELFDWQNLNILASLRDFCNRLALKAETQQVDRILDAFAWRWCVCNPNHGFKATGTHPPVNPNGFMLTGI